MTEQTFERARDKVQRESRELLGALEKIFHARTYVQQSHTGYWQRDSEGCQILDILERSAVDVTRELLALWSRMPVEDVAPQLALLHVRGELRERQQCRMRERMRTVKGIERLQKAALAYGMSDKLREKLK